MCGGAEDAYASAEPVIAAYARMCKRLGPAGSGQLTKMVNQICIAGLVEGLSERHSFCQEVGTSTSRLSSTPSRKGAAQSWQMENRYKTMNEGKFDFRLCGGMDAQGSVDLSGRSAAQWGEPPGSPVWSTRFYSEVEKMGGKRWDTSQPARPGCNADLRV